MDVGFPGLGDVPKTLACSFLKHGPQGNPGLTLTRET